MNTKQFSTLNKLPDYEELRKSVRNFFPAELFASCFLADFCNVFCLGREEAIAKIVSLPHEYKSQWVEQYGITMGAAEDIFRVFLRLKEESTMQEERAI